MSHSSLYLNSLQGAQKIVAAQLMIVEGRQRGRKGGKEGGGEGGRKEGRRVI